MTEGLFACAAQFPSGLGHGRPTTDNTNLGHKIQCGDEKTQVVSDRPVVSRMTQQVSASL